MALVNGCSPMQLVLCPMQLVLCQQGHNVEKQPSRVVCGIAHCIGSVSQHGGLGTAVHFASTTDRSSTTPCTLPRLL